MKRDFVRNACFLDRFNRIAAADDADGFRVCGDRFGNGERALGAIFDLEYAHRSVPENGPGARDLGAEELDCSWADIDTRPAIRNGFVRRSVFARRNRARVEFDLLDDVAIDRQKELHAARFGFVKRSSRGLDFIRLGERLADGPAIGQVEGVSHRAADAGSRPLSRSGDQSQ